MSGSMSVSWIQHYLLRHSSFWDRSRHFQELNAKIQVEPVHDQRLGDDKFLWRHDTEVYKDYFSATRTWECCKKAKNMLSTGDRMRQWKITQGCVQCGERD
ncbi:hypothetical protein IGI04_026763 [Brassica rapa subsp. trilocularis]|uniref:Uncharacterized protein n=1 Tax=Brassica rapa subsp. trilocularis TaxID=1813537 RepID=A0ABQ7L0W9_BRACM|nr:hypothetical protein IGI04_026763 [Brassica rapa subsp. trilocularis]